MDNLHLNFSKHSVVNIYDIADIERAVKGKIYPAGCTLIPLSAATSTPNKYMKEPGDVETRYAVAIPKDGVNSKYLFIAIERAYERFKYRYMTTINMQFGQLKHLELDYHEDGKVQDEIVRMVEEAERLERKEQAIVEHLQAQKKYFMGTMFPE